MTTTDDQPTLSPAGANVYQQLLAFPDDVIELLLLAFNGPNEVFYAKLTAYQETEQHREESQTHEGAPR